MIYYLPLEIARTRFHIAALNPLDVPNSDSPPVKPYILSKDAVQTHLFNMDADTYLVAHGGMDQDLDWSSFTVDFNIERNQLIFNFKTAKRTGDFIHDTVPYTITQNTPVQCKKTPIPMTVSGKIQMRENIAIALEARVSGVVEVVLNLVDAANQVTHTAQFLLHIVPNDNIWEVALDFGSEASQLYIPRANSGNAVNSLPIIEHLKTSFYKEHEKLTKDKFLQSDSDHFFRSVFLRAPEGVLQQTHSPNTADELVQMLTLIDQIDDLKTKKYQLLPTVKLATFGIGGTETVRLKGESQPVPMSNLVDKIHRKLIFNFLHTACQTITAKKDRYIRFKLLIPNVFNQKKITDLVEKVERDTVHFMKDFPAYRLKGIEISTLSESDAAFAGYTGTLKPDGKYLIIDVGRGTTDYSIVQTTAANQAISLYRSGFIGAGALLTFAYVDTFVAQIMKENYVALNQALESLPKTDSNDELESLPKTDLNKVRELTSADREAFCKKVICDADVKWQTQFFQLIEQLKRSRDSKLQLRSNFIPEVSDSQKVPDILKLDLGTLNGWLDSALTKHKNRAMPDTFNFIKQTTNALVQHLWNEIQKLPNVFAEVNNLDGIILSGRGFLYKPLVTALQTQFGENKVHLATQNLKKICIEGAFTNHRFNGNCNMTGIPYAAEVYGKNKKQTIHLQSPLEDTKVEPAPAKSWFKLLDGLFNNQPQLKSSKKKENANYYRDIEGFLKGYGDTHFDSATEKIYISGLHYRHDAFQTKSIVNLFFTGRHFLIRSETQACSLEPSATLATEVEKNFAAKTLFPTLGESQHVPVDKIPDSNPVL